VYKYFKNKFKEVSMEKKSERTNVLTETENKSFVHAVVNAVTKGYSDNTVLEDIIDLVRRKEVSKGVIQSTPGALRDVGRSINESLSFLANQIEELEIIDEPTVKRKIKDDGQNVVEEEMEKQEDETKVDKTASIEKFASLVVSEDWEKYNYDKSVNIITGHLFIDFKQDMSSYGVSNKIALNQNDLDYILSSVYGYFNSEFKNLKANLTPDIFTSDAVFTSIDKGLVEVDYEIKEAF
jgi:hypothetical protein